MILLLLFSEVGGPSTERKTERVGISLKLRASVATLLSSLPISIRSVCRPIRYAAR